MTKHPIPVAKRRALQLLVPAAAGLLVAGACSKKEDSSTVSSTTTTVSTANNGGGSGGSGSNGSTGTTGTAPSAHKLDTKVWSDGYTFNLKAWDQTESHGNPAIVVGVEITNNGPDNATPYGPFTLVSNGSVISTGNLKKNQPVAAGSTANDELEFTFGTDPFDPDTAVLTFGSATSQQATVPLNDPSSATTLEPQKLKEKPAPIKVGEVTLNVTKAEVRYDNPKDHSSAEKDKAFLVLSGTSANASSTKTYYFNQSDVKLDQPNGTKGTADITSDGIEPSTNNTKFIMTFDIDTPVTGVYTLDISQDWTDSGDPAQATVKLDLTPGSGTEPAGGSSGGGSGSTGTTGTTTK